MFNPDFTILSEGIELKATALAQDPLRLRTKYLRNSIAQLRTDSPLEVAAALFSLDGWCREVHLFSLAGSSMIEEPNFVSHGDANGTASLLISDRQARATEWIVYTSGTSGEPRAISHTLKTLISRNAKSPPKADLVWGLIYLPTRMAGLQVLLHTMISGHYLVATTASTDIQSKLDLMSKHGVTALSGTPTQWRIILQTNNHSRLSLRQITLGGEIVDQGLLDTLARIYPHARITHVFASTETGSVFSVSDGRAGFPSSFLNFPPNGVSLRIVDGQLEVHRPDMSVAGEDGYVATGDNVVVLGDRVMFLGRASGVANIGGLKVMPEQVEDVIRRHPNILDVVVTARPNPFSGEILTARVVVQPNSHIEPKDVRRWVKHHAPTHYVPAVVALVSSIDSSTAGKAVRK